VADIRATQGVVFSILDSDNDLKITQANVFAMYSQTAEDIKASQGFVLSLLGSSPTLKVTQAAVLALSEIESLAF
jgi:hypothetical protein